YEPNHLGYKSSANSEKLAVFSEVYYEKGWNAFIDGEPAPYFRVNYILRAIMIPPGEHTIEFKFHPKTYFMGQKISLVSSIILLLMLAGLIAMEVKKFAINKDSLPDAE
ncbi:MAG: YfhO family protein, partial [Bacteroidales bacterium]|nr:YfhO family protein [Bacteroidales bacterium]